MRLFQNSRYYPSFRPRVREILKGCTTFKSMIDAYVDFRENACHLLAPVDARAESAFFTNGDDDFVQRTWAREQGMSSRARLADILKAQIEAHRTEVFYNLDATGMEKGFITSLPGCVKKTIAWHASPLKNVRFSDYDLVVCNFPSILASLNALGCRTEYFAPAHDPEWDSYAARRNRPVDVMFVGGYSRHHERRARILEAVAGLAQELKVVYHLDRSRLCRLAESPMGYLLPLAKFRRTPAIVAATQPPVFGRDLYEALSAARIVFNGSIDMAAEDRGNMRCFEALGSGALLLSDSGNYPDGMVNEKTIATYDSPEDAIRQVRRLLASDEERLRIARDGHAMVSTSYSKNAQWKRFEALVDAI